MDKPPLTAIELAQAEHAANEALARCNRVVASAGKKAYLEEPHGGSIVPGMATTILRLVAEVRAHRDKQTNKGRASE